MESANSSIESVILDFLKDQVFRDASTDLHPEDNLLTSGLIDSMGVMRLIAHLERTFDIKVPPSDFTADNFESVAVIANYVGEMTDDIGASSSLSVVDIDPSSPTYLQVVSRITNR